MFASLTNIISPARHGPRIEAEAPASAQASSRLNATSQEQPSQQTVRSPENREARDDDNQRQREIDEAVQRALAAERANGLTGQEVLRALGEGLRATPPIDSTTPGAEKHYPPPDVKFDNVTAAFPHDVVALAQQYNWKYTDIGDVWAMRNAFKENLETIESDRLEGLASILYSTDWVEQLLGMEHDTYHDTDLEEPELQPYIVAGRPVAEQVESWRRSHQHQQIRRECVRQVTTQLRQICGDAPFEVLRDSATGFTRVTPRQMFNHLFAHHAPVTPEVKTSVDDRLKEPFDMADPAPFEKKLKDMQECQLLSLDFPNPITLERLTEYLADCFCQAQISPQRWLEWQNKPTSAKTWPNAMSFFRTGFDEYKALANITGATTPTINNIDASIAGDSISDSTVTQEQLATILDNLACAVTSGQSNEALDTRLDDLITMVKKIDGRLGKMEKTLQELRSGGVSSGGGGSNDRSQWDRQQRENDRQHSTRYCWSHGYAVGPGHDSSTCSKKKEGHKDSATRANTMGGSAYGAGFGKKPNGSERN